MNSSLSERLREASKTLRWAGVGLSVAPDKSNEALAALSEALTNAPDLSQSSASARGTIRNLSLGMLPKQEACIEASLKLREIADVLRDRESQPRTLGMVLRGV